MARGRASVPGWVALRGALHVHTGASRDSEAPFSDLHAGAQAAELDFVALTEHVAPGVFAATVSGERDGVLYLPGLEYIRGCRGLADRCVSLLAIGLEREVEGHESLALPALVAAVREAGALPFVAHPKGWRDWSIPGLAGLEVYDTLDDVLERPLAFPRFALAVLRAWDAHPEEVWLEILDRPAAHLARLDALLAERHWSAIGACDAHRNIHHLGRQLDPYPITLRHVTTHVWAREKSRIGVLEALEQGRGFVAFELVADARGFVFAAETADGLALPGARPVAGARRLVLRSPLEAQVTLLRDGAPVRACRCSELTLESPEPGIYRAELALDLGGRERPWILTNAVRVE